MSEFAGSTPIGGVSVVVEYDDSGYAAFEKRMVSRLRNLEKNAKVAIGGGPNIGGTSNGDVSLGGRGFVRNIQAATSASETFYRRQQALQKAFEERHGRGGGAFTGGGGGGGRGSRRPNMDYYSAQGKPKSYEDAYGLDSLFKSIPKQMKDTQQALRRDARAAEKEEAQQGGGAQQQGGGAGGGRRGLFNRNINFSGSLGRVFSVYGIAHVTEAMADFGTASIETTRDMRIAQTNSQRVEAILKQRRATEAAAGQIPIAGQLGISLRNFIDAAIGHSAEDIARTGTEAQQNADIAQGQTDRMRQRRRLNAQLSQGGYGPAGSFAGDLAMVDEGGRESLEASKDRRDAELNKYQNEPETVARNPIVDFLSIVPAGKDQGAVDRNSDKDSIKKGISKGYDAIDSMINRQTQQARANLMVNESLQRQELNYRIVAAKEAQRMQFAEAQATTQLGQFNATIASTRYEFKSLAITKGIEEEKANRAQLLSEVGSQYATSVDAGRDVVGDPLGIRGHNDPLWASNHVIQGMEAMQNVEKTIGKIFDAGALVFGR